VLLKTYKILSLATKLLFAFNYFQSFLDMVL
jgi:hypothetical protein